MKTILCPIDFSETAIKALLYAYDLAMKSEAKLLLLHTYHIPTIITLLDRHLEIDPETSIRYEREIREKMENLIAWLNKIYAPVKVNTTCYVASNFAVDEIVKITMEESVDLIVIGANEIKEPKDIFLGTTTIRIIEETHCPILAIPATASYKKINRILYTTHTNTPNKEELNFITKVATLFSAEVTLLPTQKEMPATSYPSYEKPSASSDKHYSVSATEHNHTDQDVLQTMYTFCQQKPADLLGISMQRRNLLGLISSKNSTTKAANPLLCMPILITRK